MANSAGRDLVVKKNNVAIASVRTKSFNWQGQTIDVTTDDEDGATTFLADRFASTSLEVSVSGLTDTDVLFDLALSTTDSDKFLSDITLERPNGDVLSGDWVLTGYTETGEYQGATTFDATLVRNGLHTLTAAV